VQTVDHESRLWDEACIERESLCVFNASLVHFNTCKKMQMVDHESRDKYKWAMSHVWMCVDCEDECVMSHTHKGPHKQVAECKWQIHKSCHIYEWVWKSRTYKCVKSHAQRGLHERVAKCSQQIHKSCHMYERACCARERVSCRTYEWAIFHSHRSMHEQVAGCSRQTAYLRKGWPLPTPLKGWILQVIHV